VRAGDLVRIKRASIGIPMGTLALVEAKLKDTGGFSGIPDAMWRVQLLYAGRTRRPRYLGRDLEVVNASR
jgi:hypothetical protein